MNEGLLAISILVGFACAAFNWFVIRHTVLYRPLTDSLFFATLLCGLFTGPTVMSIYHHRSLWALFHGNWLDTVANIAGLHCLVITILIVAHFVIWLFSGRRLLH